MSFFQIFLYSVFPTSFFIFYVLFRTISFILHFHYFLVSTFSSPLVSLCLFSSFIRIFPISFFIFLLLRSSALCASPNILLEHPVARKVCGAMHIELPGIGEEGRVVEAEDEEGMGSIEGEA